MGQPLYSNKFTRQIRDMIAFGAVEGWSAVEKFGQNTDLGTTVEDVWSTGGAYTYLTSASQLEVVSASANDTAAGSGARSVYIDGLDADFKSISEIVATNGTTAVPTVNSYLRVNRMYVVSSGTYGQGSAGNITLRVVSGGATQCTLEQTTADTIAWDYGQSQLARYCVPAGKVAFLSRVFVNCESNKRADFAFYQRQNSDDITSAPYNARRAFFTISGISSAVDKQFDAPIFFPQKTDIIVRARLSNGANGRVATRFTLFVGPQSNDAFGASPVD